MTLASHHSAATRPISRIARSGTLAVFVLGFAGIWWLLSARKWFTGPRVQGSPEELQRIERELESLA